MEEKLFNDLLTSCEQMAIMNEEARNKAYLDSKDEDDFDLNAALVRGAKFIEVLRKRPPLEISDELSKLDQSMGLY